MAVSGRKNSFVLGSEEFVEITCKPCEDDGKYTAANGLCQECDENMCSSCFGHHRKGKFCKDHVLLDLGCSGSVRKSTSASDDGLAKCEDHFKELVKFYCIGHDQVGCGDCMVFKHKACKVEYISDKAIGVKESKELEDIEKDMKNCSTQVQECLSAIQKNRNAAEVVHVTFICDLEEFKNEIIEHINKLTTDMCAQADDIKTRDISYIDLIEQEAFNMKTEVSAMGGKLESHKDQPNKLFATIVQLRNQMKNTKEKIVEIKKNNSIEEYTFQRNSQIKSAMVDCKNLGQLQRCPHNELEKISLDRNQRNVSPDVESGEQLRTITLKKESGALGFSVMGCVEKAPVFVLRVLKGSPAGESGSILKGDKIISINDIDTRETSQQNAVKLLQQGEQTKLVLRYCIEEFSEFLQKHHRKNRRHEV